MVQKAVGIVGLDSRRTRRRFRAELASAGGSPNLCPGPVVRVDRVLDVSTVATRGARTMPGAFEDAEDGTLRRAIFRRDLPSSNAACHLSARSAIFERRVPPSGAVRRLRAWRAIMAKTPKTARALRMQSLRIRAGLDGPMWHH